MAGLHRGLNWLLILCLLLFAAASGAWLAMSADLATARETHRHTLSLLALTAFGSAGLIALFIHLSVSRRLTRLLNAIGRFANGRTDVRLGWIGTDIVSRLGMQFDYMVMRLAEERTCLVEGEERLDFALHGSSAGIWDWRLDRNHTYYSPRWLSLLGFGEAALPSHPEEWLKRVHPEDLPQVMQRLNAHLEGEKDFFESEHRLRRKDGSYLWVLERGRAIRDEDGRAFRMVGALTDITGRKEAESALRQNEEKYRTILNLSPDGFVFADCAGRVTYVNPAFLAMTGFVRERVEGGSLTALEEGLRELCDPARTPPRAAGGMDEFEDTLHLVKPAILVLKRLTRGIRDDQGSLQGGIMFFRDVTREAEVDRMKSEFLSTAAHELRTPMASIFGFAELLLARDFDAATRHELHEIIHRQTRNLINLVNELLDLARIEARGGKSFQFRAQPLQPIVANAVASQFLPAETHRIETDLPPDLPWVSVDAEKLQQALANVLGNAVKYSPRGGTIQVSATRRQAQGRDLVGIAVRDQGIGMTPEQLARVFDRFYRADPSNTIPGTGLGMCLVKEIMEIMKGEITISSVVDQGTEVILWLPSHAHPDR